MNTTFKLAAAMAAVLAIAVVGYSLLPDGGTGVGGPGPTAIPTAIPTASPSSVPSAAPTASPSAARAQYPAWFTPDSDATGAGILPAGTQTTRAFTTPFTYSVPEGWVNDMNVSIGYGLFPDTPANKAEYALSGETAHGIFMVSVESPYFYCEAWEKTRGTAAERAAFLGASEAFAVSEPVDVTIGGLTGKQVDVRLDPDWKETCPGDPPTSDHRDQRDRVIFLDTPDRGVIAIAVGSKHAADHEAFLADAMPIVESFDFTP